MALKVRSGLDDSNEGSFFDRELDRREQELNKNTNPAYGVELNAKIVNREGPFTSQTPPPGLEIDLDEWNTDIKWYRFICKPQKTTQHIIENPEDGPISNINSSYKNLLIDTSLDSNFYFYNEEESLKINDRVLVAWDHSGDEVKFIRLLYSSKKATNKSPEEKQRLRDLVDSGTIRTLNQTYNGPDIQTNFPNQFSLSKLIRQDKYRNNTPDNSQFSNLQALVTNLLDPIQQRLSSQGLGQIQITSGFRGDDINKSVGGSKNSQHRFGQAVDFAVPSGFDSKTFSEWINKENFDFDQMIWYDPNIGGHIHISYVSGRNRKQWLHAYKKDGKTKYDSYDGTAKDIEKTNTDV